MVKNAMGYGALPWDHERALEVEVELAAWLVREIPGRIIWTGTGPDIRERFKPKFNLVVFSSPDFVFVPEFRRDGGVIGWGEPLSFDVTERVEYAWGGFGFPTVYAQTKKVDVLARIGNQAYLAYKWKDGIWVFARVKDIAALGLKPKMVDTVIGGKRIKQKNYSVPRELWYAQAEFKTLMLNEINKSEPIDRVELFRKIDGAREDDMREHVSLLMNAFGIEHLREIARYCLAIKPMIEWDRGRELEPALYIMQRVLKRACKRSDAG